MTEPTEPSAKKRPQKKRDWWKKNRQTVGYILLIPLVLLLVGFTWTWYAPCWTGGCAPTDDLSRFQAEGSELVDANGETFGRLATVDRRIVSLDSVPEQLVNAFLAIEDSRFYEHNGLDPRRFGAAILQNVAPGEGLEGGSTITMQLARNLFPDQLPYEARTMRRKIMEIRVARQLERQFPKDKILELYLNHIYLGSGAYGVEAAARTYFDKSVTELELHEAATLAGLPQRPSRVNPHENPDAARERRNLVLRRMEEAGMISASESAEAQEREMESARVSTREEDNASAGYFRERVRRILEEEIGSRFYTDGLRIHTTLDLSMQRAAEEEIDRQLTSIENGAHGAFRHTPYEAVRDPEQQVTETAYLQGVAIILDSETGAVRALVGGRDYDDSKFDRAMQAHRQPGSAFKPFVYLSALQRGRSPIYRIEDAPIEIDLTGGRSWRPRNFDRRFDGMMTLREALTRSKNVPTVRLSQEIGIRSVIRTAGEMGIESEIQNMPSTALGAAEVIPMELVAAYAPFANGGHQVEPHFITRVEDRDGRVLWENEASPGRNAIDAAESFVLTTILRDVVDRGTGAAVRAEGFPHAAAGKTGTTNGATDVWFIGYTTDHVGGVWIGFDEPRTIVSGATGGRLAAPVWARMMQRVYQGRQAPGEWTRPQGVSTATAGRATGQIVSDRCPGTGQTYTEYFIGSPPPPGPCPRDGEGRYLDDLYGEDWGAFEEEDFYGDPGVDWPELEDRRRGEGRDDREDRERMEDPQERDTQPEFELFPDPADPEPPEPEPEPEPDDDPDLLGDPVRRDDRAARLPGTKQRGVL